jgi:hypothetical protein
MKWFFVVITFYAPEVGPKAVEVEALSYDLCNAKRARIEHVLEVGAEDDPALSYVIGECKQRKEEADVRTTDRPTG